MTGVNKFELKGRAEKVRRYAIRIDADAVEMGMDPLDKATAATIVEKLKALTPAQWWALSREMKEPSFPSPDTVREILNVYRVRAWLPAEEAPAPVERPVREVMPSPTSYGFRNRRYDSSYDTTAERDMDRE